jgi:cytoskeleton protein RodZ
MAVSEDIDLQGEVNQTQQAQAPLGELLSAARIAKKLTQQDVSNSLRFSVKQIDALENNQFDVLPDAMITRGFIRNYARLLEIDVEPLLLSYRALVPDNLPSNLSVQSSMREVSLTKESLPWLKYILGSIVVLLFLLAWFFYMDHQSKMKDVPEAKVPEINTGLLHEDVEEASLPEIALPAAERQSGEDDANISGANPDIVSPEVVAQASGNVAANSAVNLSEQSLPLPIETSQNRSNNQGSAIAVPVNPSQVKPVQGNPVANTQLIHQSDVDNQLPSQAALPLTTSLAKKSVSLSVTEQTWVSVTDKSGKVVFEKMLSADDVDGFDAIPPLNVVIGNAKATKLTFAGEPVSFSAQPGSNVARIRLE